MSEQSEPGGSVEENLPLVTFIQLTRVYDVLLALLQEQNPAKAEMLHNLHEQGDFLSPPPALAPLKEDV